MWFLHVCRLIALGDGVWPDGAQSMRDWAAALLLDSD